MYKLAVITLLIFAVFVLVGGKNKKFGEYFVVPTQEKGYFYGDLYAFSEIEKFKIKIPTSPLVLQTSTLQSADIIAFGDSFFEVSYETSTLPRLLQNATGLSVFAPLETVDNPLLYLEQAGYVKGRPKIMILETVERYAIQRASMYSAARLPIKGSASVKKTINKIAYDIFDGTNIDYFFKHNVIVNPFRLALKELNFTLFNRIDRRIGAYTVDPPTLFYFEEVNFANNFSAPSFTPGIAEQVKVLSDTLLERYNIVLMYVVIPDKYSIYHSILPNSRYNGFLIELQAQLNARDVISPNVYGAFMNHVGVPNAPLLYYPNDTHFTPVAKDMLVQALKGWLHDVVRQFN